MTENILSKSQYKEFSLWVIDFEHSRLGKKAIDALRGIYGDYSPELQNRFKEEVLRACYYAFLFWHMGDVNSEKRTLLRDVSSLNDKLHDKLKDVISEISFFHTIHDTLITEGMREIMGDDVADTSQFIGVDDLICHLEMYRIGIDRLQNELETHGNRTECWLHGNMRHPERIDGINQHQGIKAATCLMFQLAIFFRLWTHPKGQKLFDKNLNLNIPKDGVTMPKEGLRHDKIITDFINATFANEAIAIKLQNTREDAKYHKLDDSYSVSAITARIEKTDPQIRLIPWTDASFDLSIKIPEVSLKNLKKLTQKTA